MNLKEILQCLGIMLYFTVVLVIYFFDLNPGQPDPGAGVVLTCLGVMAVLGTWLYFKDRALRRQREDLREKMKELQNWED